MSISAESVRLDNDQMWVALSDGRTLGVPLAWFPRLMRASAEARDAYEISAFGSHRAAQDEDISVAGLLAGRGDGKGVGGAVDPTDASTASSTAYCRSGGAPEIARSTASRRRSRRGGGRLDRRPGRPASSAS